MKQDNLNTKDSFEDLEDVQLSLRSGRRPISRVLQEMGIHFTEILRSEVRLASAEIRQDVTKVAKASLFLIVSAVFGLYAFGLILLAVVYALQEIWPPWASALTVGSGVGVLAGIFLMIGQKRLRSTSLRPDKTIQSLEDNITWLKKQTK